MILQHRGRERAWTRLFSHRRAEGLNLGPVPLLRVRPGELHGGFR